MNKKIYPVGRGQNLGFISTMQILKFLVKPWLNLLNSPPPPLFQREGCPELGEGRSEFRF
jgi:hypothetical protein